MSSFRFADPWWLLLIVPLFLATWTAIRLRQRGSILYSSVQLLAGLPDTWTQRVKRALPWVNFGGLALVAVATARPQAGLSEFRVRAEGIAIVMCLDRSGSMEALDFTLDGDRVNRLAVVKSVFRDFVVGKGELGGRPDDAIGLVSFGGFAESKVPLTLDHGVILDVLQTIEIAQPIYDRTGKVLNQRFYEEDRATAIGDALALAVERLRGAEAKSKVIILLSDGENTAGLVEPSEAAELAKKYGIKVYSIGVGSQGRVPFPVEDMFGQKRLVAKEVTLDEETLRRLAETTGGKYFRASGTDALESVYREIDQLEKTVSEGATYTAYRELFVWSLVPGMALVFGIALLRCTRFRELA